MTKTTQECFEFSGNKFCNVCKCDENDCNCEVLDEKDCKE
jgi:hypothetical protein